MAQTTSDELTQTEISALRALAARSRLPALTPHEESRLRSQGLIEEGRVKLTRAGWRFALETLSDS